MSPLTPSPGLMISAVRKVTTRLGIVVLLPLSTTWAGNVWDGEGGNGNWTNQDNWNGNTLPSSPTGLTFGGSSQLNSHNDLFAAGTTFNGLTFNSTTGAFVLTGNGITLGGNISLASAALQTINLDLTLSGMRTVSIQANGAQAVLGGNIGGTGGLLISRNASNSGVVTLSGTNTYSGTTTVASGTTLNINSSTAIGTGALSTSGGHIDNTSGAAIRLTNNNDVVLSTTLTFIATNDLDLGGGTVSLGGASGSGRQVVINGGTLTLGSIVHGTDASNPTRNIGKSGMGTLALGGANNQWYGLLTINEGTVRLEHAEAMTSLSGLNFASPGILQLNGHTGTVKSLTSSLSALSIIENGAATDTEFRVNRSPGNSSFGGIIRDGGVGKLAFTKNGAGTLSFINQHTYTGETTVHGGILTLDFSSAPAGISSDLISSASALVLGGGGIGITGRSATANTQAFASTHLTSGGSAVTLSPTGGGSVTLNLGAITREIGGTVNFATSGSGTVTTTTQNAFGTILGGYASVAGNTWAVSAGDGETAGAITGLAAYSTGFAAGADVNATTGNSAPGEMSINSLRFHSSGSYVVDLQGGLEIASGGILITGGVGTNSVTINGGSITSGNGTDLIIIQNNVGSGNRTVTINSSIGDNGIASLGLSKSGGGLLVLRGENTYSGGTVVNGGFLNISADANLGLAPTLPANNIILNGGGLQFAAAFDLNENRNIVLSETGDSTFDTNVFDVGIASAISGEGNLIKLGTGTLVLSGGNTYTGYTVVGTANGAHAGAITLEGAGKLSATGLRIYGGTVALTDTVQTVTPASNLLGDSVAMTLGGGSSASKATLDVGTGELRLGGNVNFDATQNSLGAVISGTSGMVSLLGNRTFNVGNSSAAAADLTISAIIRNGDGDAYQLHKTGAGTLVLSGDNTYTGRTTVAAGSLIIQGTIASSSDVAVEATASLGGHGRVSQITGTGRVAPGWDGNTAILSANSVNAGSGMGFAFNFTQANSAPDYGHASDPGNSLLRLTEGTGFTANLTQTNAISLYLGVSGISYGDVFEGGFYVDGGDFFSAISGATFVYYIADAEGSVIYDGMSYSIYGGPFEFEVATIQRTANFGGGNIDGYATTFIAVPEPASWLLLGLGVGTLLFTRRRGVA